MKRVISSFTISVCLLLPAAGMALAADPHTSAPTGQPNQMCLSSTAPTEPGSAGSAIGSAFNENGGIAGGVYAGNGLNNNINSHTVAQYDVACFQVSNQIP